MPRRAKSSSRPEGVNEKAAIEKWRLFLRQIGRFIRTQARFKLRKNTEVPAKFYYKNAENATRIADGINWLTREYSEIKNVAKLSRLKQITDGIAYAKKSNLTYVLYVRQGAKLTGPLQKLVDSGDIILKGVVFPGG